MIEIRAFQRQDGEGISALFRTVYGDRYVYPDIYMPSLIGWRNARDEWHSAVAEQNGIIIGHAALWRHHADKQTAELAMFAVHPAWCPAIHTRSAWRRGWAFTQRGCSEITSPPPFNPACVKALSSAYYPCIHAPSRSPRVIAAMTVG